MKYLSVGHIMIDKAIYVDGSEKGPHKGGPAAFGYAGIRLWTDDCLLAVNVGADFYDYYTGWLKDNHVPTSGIKVKSEHCNHHVLAYHADGSYDETSIYGKENMRILDPTAQDIEDHIDNDTVGIYFDRHLGKDFWEGIKGIKSRHAVKMMWEIPTTDAVPDKLPEIEHNLKICDFFSLNVHETKRLFGLKTEEEAVEKLSGYDNEMIFLRAGVKGAYVITDHQSVFVPSVLSPEDIDPTGCGNCSTAVSMYAFCETGDPLKTGIVANISAAYNAKQFGVPPLITKQMRADAKNLAQRLYGEYKGSK